MNALAGFRCLPWRTGIWAELRIQGANFMKIQDKMIQQHTWRGTIWRKKIYWRLAQIPILNLKIFFENFIHVGNEIQSYPPISHLQLLQTEWHPSLSSWPFPFLFNNLLSQFSFLYVHECGPSTGAWQTCQWPYPQRRMIYQPLPHSPSSSSSVRDESLWASPHLCWNCNWLNLLLVLPFYNWKNGDSTERNFSQITQPIWSWSQDKGRGVGCRVPQPHSTLTGRCFTFGREMGSVSMSLELQQELQSAIAVETRLNTTVIKTG